MAKRRILLTNVDPSSLNPDSSELSRVIINRIGLMPRKTGSTKQIYRVLIELYERTKLANKEKKPELSVLTVEEMGNFAGITRQTMYDYLKRWIDLDLIAKTTYIYQGKVIIGYKLNGNTLENAFEKAAQRINNHVEITLKYVRELQKTLKNENEKINALNRQLMMEYSEIQSGVTVYQKSKDELLMFVPLESDWEEVTI